MLPVAHVEAGVTHQLNRIAIEIAPSREGTPDAVEPVLYPPVPTGIGLPVFKKDQASAGLQDAVDFAQRLRRIWINTDDSRDRTRASNSSARPRFAPARTIGGFGRDGGTQQLALGQDRHQDARRVRRGRLERIPVRTNRDAL